MYRQFKNLSLGLGISSLLCASLAQAVSLTTFRIYMDTDENTASFVMFNKGASDEKCELSLVHNSFDASGKMTPYEGKDLPPHSAEPWIRYSPRTFEVKAGEPQTVRFTLRRKANMPSAEFRSYLRVFCDEVKQQVASSKAEEGLAKLAIKPRLVQNVPIVVRTGKLHAELSFSDVEVSADKVLFNLNRQGNRSVYGTLSLVDKKTGEILTSRKNISVYTESSSVAYDLDNRGQPASNLLLRFEEDQSYGGSLTVEKAL